MSLWTVQQHEWLRALGHPVLLLAGDPGLLPAESAEARPAAAGALPGPSSIAPAHPDTRTTPRQPDPTRRPSPSSAAGESAAPAPARRAPVENPLKTDDAVARPDSRPEPRADAAAKKAALEQARSVRRETRPEPPAPALDDPLLQAIALASGLDTEAFEAAATTLEIDLDQLRASPSAKRALWLKLRGLRRSRRA